MEVTAMDILTTGRLARLTDVNKETIRYYERRGLLNTPPRSTSGYRAYPQEAIAIVRFIKRAQALGFSLKEVAELLTLSGNSGTDCGDMRDTAMRKLEYIKVKIKGLKAMEKTLKKIIKACPGKGPLSKCSIVGSLNEADNSALK
jgi:MerR family mercuric resistance operon transcriptional regulator